MFDWYCTGVWIITNNILGRWLGITPSTWLTQYISYSRFYNLILARDSLSTHSILHFNIWSFDLAELIFTSLHYLRLPQIIARYRLKYKFPPSLNLGSPKWQAVNPIPGTFQPNFSSNSKFPQWGSTDISNAKFEFCGKLLVALCKPLDLASDL